ncbi:MAG: biotin-dependent carboxyltransferase family protein [Emticicia sp.]|nr:biotin-dependent carboxyltransferase family protein [Emticicia sp.]
MKFIKKGILSTYQNLGKNGLRHLGINPSGAMDRFSARLLNIALQNDENQPILEMHFPAPEILFEADSTIIIGGADFLPSIDNQPIKNWKAILVKTGSVLRFKKIIAGSRAYLAVKKENCNFLPYVGQFCKQSHKNTIHFTEGNEFELLTESSKKALENQVFTISNASNRMGYRMNAEPLEVGTKKELVSSAVDFGTIQLLPSGQIIVLMADHQTSGGYPRLGNIISVDLPKLAQSGINETIILKKVSIQEAEDLLIQQELELQKLKASIRFFNDKQKN